MSTAPVRIQGPGDLVAAVPHLVGFMPTRSVVALPFIGNALGQPIARMDLPTSDNLPALIDAGKQHKRLAGDGMTLVILIVFSDDLALATEAAMTLMLTVYDSVQVFIVDGDRYRPINGDWEPVPHGSDPMWEARTGVTVAPSREALGERFKPSPSSTVHAAESVTEEDAIAAWQQVLDGDPTLDDEVLSMAATALRDRRFRDRLIGTLRPKWRTLDPLDLHVEESATQPFIVADMVRRLPADLAADALCVAASMFWADGNGAAADLATDSALECEPGHRLAALLHQTIALGMR